MRAFHNLALINEFQRRGIDASAVNNGKALSFARPIRYDISENKLTVIAFDGSNAAFE